jgi:hypothetical protein
VSPGRVARDLPTTEAAADFGRSLGFLESQFTEIEEAAVSKSAARFDVWPLVLIFFGE